MSSSGIETRAHPETVSKADHAGAAAWSPPVTMACAVRAPETSRFVPIVVVVIGIVALASPIAYAFYTGHVWEDFFITFRHSRNLAAGNGLVYHAGERVHGFTSPIGTLLPGLFDAITGRRESYLPALWAFRIASAMAYAGAGLLMCLAMHARHPSLGTLAPVAMALLFLTDAKCVAFSANGQEAAFLLLFVGLATYLLGTSHNWLWLGVCWAGMQWTRP